MDVSIDSKYFSYNKCTYIVQLLVMVKEQIEDKYHSNF